MLISTKGRYALRVMVDLAEHHIDSNVPLAAIAARQGISEKYLESIMSMLSRRHMVEALRGKGGGYRLNRAPADYIVYDILSCTEQSLAPVACLVENAKPCDRAAECRTLKLWKGLDNVIADYLKGITIRDLMQEGLDDDQLSGAVL